MHLLLPAIGLDCNEFATTLCLWSAKNRANAIDCRSKVGREKTNDVARGGIS